MFAPNYNYNDSLIWDNLLSCPYPGGLISRMLHQPARSGSGPGPLHTPGLPSLLSGGLFSSLGPSSFSFLFLSLILHQHTFEKVPQENLEETFWVHACLKVLVIYLHLLVDELGTDLQIGNPFLSGFWGIAPLDSCFFIYDLLCFFWIMANVYVLSIHQALF